MYIDKINTKATTLIVSHADLDGISSALVMAKELESTGVPYSIKCHMSPVAGMTDKLLKEYSENVNTNIQVVYILDRASDIKVLNNMKKYFPKLRKVYIFDHHISQQDFYTTLNKLNCGYQIEAHVDYQICTTRILSRYVSDVTIAKFGLIVDSWDTFKWKNDPESDIAKMALKLNAYAGVLGPLTAYNAFEDGWQNIREARFERIDGLNLIWNAYQNKIESEINRIMPLIQYMDVVDKFTNKSVCKIGFVPVHVDGDVVSMVYNKILDEYRDMENYSTTTLPTVLFGVGDNGIINVRASESSSISALEFVRMLDETSGGHKNASGGNIAPAFTMRNLLHNMLFSSKRLIEDETYILKSKGSIDPEKIDLVEAVNSVLAKTTFTAQEAK